VTVIFAVYAAGTFTGLLVLGRASDDRGRRPLLLLAIALELLAGVVFLATTQLVGLLAARMISGLAVGIATPAATALLRDLRPGSSEAAATAANIGGLGAGALMSGIVAQWSAAPLTTPYLVAMALLGAAALGLLYIPETAPRNRREHSRQPRIAIAPNAGGTFAPAAMLALVAYASLALFVALVPTLLVDTLGNRSHALAGAMVGGLFGSAATAQLALGRFGRKTKLGLGFFLTNAGLIALVVALASEWLAPMLVACVMTGAGAGLLFRAAVTAVSDATPATGLAATLTAFFLAAYLGQSIPVVVLGIGTEYLRPASALLAFILPVATASALGTRSLLRCYRLPSKTLDGRRYCAR
jgi:MFS family permease